MGDVTSLPTTTAPPAPEAIARTSGLTWLAMATTVVLWASAFVGIRSAGHDFSPGSLALGRVIAGSVALTVIVVIVRRRRRYVAERHANLGSAERSTVDGGVRRMSRRDLGYVAIWGVAWMGGYNVTLNAAERHLDAGTAALIVNTAPVLVAVLAGFILGEGFPRRLLLGVAIAFAGVALIAFTTSSGRISGVGVVLGLASAVLFAGSAIAQKLILPRVDALTMTWLGCSTAVIACLPFAPTMVRELADAPSSAILAVVYLGVFPTAIAFSTWGYALARTTAGRLTAATYAVPPLVIVFSWLLLDELPTATAVLGGAIALTGVAVATLRRRSR